MVVEKGKGIQYSTFLENWKMKMASLCAFHDIHKNSLNLILISFLTATSYKLTYGSFASILVHSS